MWNSIIEYETTAMPSGSVYAPLKKIHMMWKSHVKRTTCGNLK